MSESNVVSEERMYELFSTLITNVAEDMHKIAVDHQFYDEAAGVNKGEKIALMHSELSELLEAEREPFPLKDKHCPEFYSAEIEAADLLIRLLDYCACFGYNIGDALVAKMKFNKQRPIKHGKEF